MTPAQLDEARRYGNQKLRLGLLDKALDLVFLTAAALLLARPLDAWLAERGTSATGRLALLYLAVMGLHALVSFPIAWRSGFVMEHRFGLSRQSFGRWFGFQALALGVAVPLGLAMVVGWFWIIWLCGPWWWPAAAAAYYLSMVVMGRLAPVLILPLFYKTEPLDDPDLTERLQRLAAGTRLTLGGVFRLRLGSETKKANAMLTGMGRSRRVLLSDTLLDQFTPEEIEVIFAHEVGHHVFRHLPKRLLEGAVFSLLGFWLCDRAALAWMQSTQSEGVAQAASTVLASPLHALPVHALPLMMLVLTLYMLLVSPLQNALSRRDERQCDRYAIDRTGHRAAYVSAFQKLARQNKANPVPHPLEVRLFHDHPPIAERIAMAKE